MLSGKKIILGVCGGIAAYKSAWLVRLLIREGAEVRVVMTSAAEDFVTAKTLSVLSKNEVLKNFFDARDNWNNHVHHAEWADLILICPLTANTLSAMANGGCDNLLLAIYLSAKCPVYVAPAMDLEMYAHPSVIENLKKLVSFGNHVIPAETGELASGLVGEGRMSEPGHIIAFIKNHMAELLPLYGKKALVNSGPTSEAIDPVRFIGNRSSGKMGAAIADALVASGAEVTLVMGHGAVRPVSKSVKLIEVETGNDMYEACMKYYKNSDIVICAAAVADFRPLKTESKKIKKSGTGTLALELEKTTDILAELGKNKNGQFLVGFALETDNLAENAMMKLKEKNLDMIIANSAAESGAGIGSDNNRISIIDKDNKNTDFELKSKKDAASDIVNAIITKLKVK